MATEQQANVRGATRLAARAALLAIAGALLLACQEPPPPLTPPAGEASEVAARIGSSEITRADLEREIGRQNPTVRRRYRSLARKQALLQELLDREALYLEARRRGRERDPAFQADYKKLLAEHFRQTEIVPEPSDIVITDEEIAREYGDHYEQYHTPPRVRLRQLLFEAPRSDPPRRHAALERARAARTQMLEQPWDDKRLKALAQPPAEGGAGVAVTLQSSYGTPAELRESHGAAFAEAAFALDFQHRISEVVESDRGYSVLQLVGLEPAIDLSLEAVADAIHDRLQAERRDAAVRDAIDELQRDLGVERFPEVLARVRAGAPADEGDGAAPAKATGGRTLRVLTDRTADYLDRLFDYYEKAHGVTIITNTVGDGLLSRLTQRPREADLVLTKNADLLELAKQQELLTPFRSDEVRRNVPPEFRDPQSYYTVLAFRARTIFFAKDRVSSRDLSTYGDLTRPRWKGRVCIRSGFHEYNLSWLSQMAASEGLEHTADFLRGLGANLARPPKGNDRAQVRGLLERQCDVAVANAYYMGIMLQNDEQRPWAEASDVLFPDQGGRGAYVLRSGAALTTARRNAEEANRLLGFLTGDFAQRFFSEGLFEYPVKRGVPLAPVNQALGRTQGIAGGAFKINLVSLEEAVKYRDRVIALLTRSNFDRR